MDEENKIITPHDTNDGVFTKKDAKRIYITAFTTGFLLAALIALLYITGPSLYSHYIKHTLSPDVKMKMIYDLMEKYYIDDIDKEEMYEGIYAGMAAFTTDRYSYYMTAEDAESYTEKTNGNYVGIGIQIIANDDNALEVTGVFKPSPAEDSGIQKGDILKSVSGVDVNADNIEDAVDLVRGPENTMVDFVIYRPSENKDYEMSCYRKNIDQNTVFGRMLDEHTGYIKIASFDGVTPDQYMEELDKLTKAGMTKLVVDVRDNPGGLLTSISSIADTLLPKGTLTYTEDKYGKRDYYYTDDVYLPVPLVVLANENSASAAKLFCGAVKDTGSGKIVGKTTYGKGVVQVPYPLPDGSILKLTTARYYTPNGICVDGVGITPDYEVDAAEDFEMPDLYDEDAVIDIEADLQLKKALEVLKNETR